MDPLIHELENRREGELPLNASGTKAQGFKAQMEWDLPGGPVAKALHSHCRWTRSLPGGGARSHMLQLRVRVLQRRPRGRWEGESGWGRHVNPRPFHFNV